VLVSSERRYRSSLRDEQAQQTRKRIRESARRLFADQGFASTTVAQIAKEAGVSQPTVYAAYESKAGIVLAMLDDMQESVDVGPRIKATMEGSDARQQLRMWLAAHVDLFNAGADILRAAMQASESPEVRTLVERGDAARRAVIEGLVGQWDARGVLRDGLSPADAADRLWLLTTVEGFLNATDRLGWKTYDYERWVGDLAEFEVLGVA
jgi:AcrR family transcriptional regulator